METAYSPLQQVGTLDGQIHGLMCAQGLGRLISKGHLGELGFLLTAMGAEAVIAHVKLSLSRLEPALGIHLHGRVEEAVDGTWILQTL